MQGKCNCHFSFFSFSSQELLLHYTDIKHTYLFKKKTSIDRITNAKNKPIIYVNKPMVKKYW